jgi:hypothetical protein
MSSFSSPEDFLKHVQFVHERSLARIQGSPNLEFQRIQLERTKNQEIPEDPHGAIVKELWRSLCEVIDERTRMAISDRVCVGALDNLAVNAQCVRSDDGHIAIVLNRGLLTLFNKVSKLLIASNQPGSVIYCNRGPAEQVTPEVAREWMVGTCDHYARTGLPLGPQIHLTNETQGLHASQLQVWELFTLAHELAHVLAGHLESRDHCMADPTLGDVLSHVDEAAHDRETQADVIAYLLLLRIRDRELLRTNTQSEDNHSLLAVVILLFNLLHMLGSRQSPSHPDPLDRLCNIAANVYGEAFAERLAASYGDQTILDTLFDQPLIPTLNGRESEQ